MCIVCVRPFQSFLLAAMLCPKNIFQVVLCLLCWWYGISVAQLDSMRCTTGVLSHNLIKKLCSAAEVVAERLCCKQKDNLKGV